MRPVRDWTNTWRQVCRWGPLLLFLGALGALAQGASVLAVLSAALLALCLLLSRIPVGLRRSSEASTATTNGDFGVQEHRVVVHHGYHPTTIAVDAGSPVRLVFDRREAGDCSAWLVFPALGLARQLAPHTATAVEFVPEQPGSFHFSCKYGVCRGTLLVRERGTGRRGAMGTRPPGQVTRSSIKSASWLGSDGEHREYHGGRASDRWHDLP